MTTKVERLQGLLKNPDFSDLVPPLVVIPAYDLREEEREWDLQKIYYHQQILEHQSYFLTEINEKCGEPPWIIRSTGLEDGEDFINAGGYASLICPSASEFAKTAAAVALSGFDPRAVEQQRLADPHYTPTPIACFVQPLIDSGSAPSDPSEIPYLDARAGGTLFSIITRLHKHFGEIALDTEWALETDQGLVSVTGLTTAGPEGAHGQLAFGFGFGAAQSPGERANATAFHWPSLPAPLWHGERLRQVHLRKTWLVQVRPAPGYTLHHRVDRLTAATREALQSRLRAVPVTPILRARTPRQGPFLAAPILDDAWSRYLALPASARADLAAVFVATGAASEHAGLMFRQQGVPVFLTALAQVPPTSGVVIDTLGSLAWFGPLTPAPVLETEPEECFDIPTQVQWVFDRQDAPPPGQAPPRQYVEEFLRTALAAMPPAFGLEALETLAHRSIWPTDTWLRSGKKVRSPSALGWLLACAPNAGLEMVREKGETSALAYCETIEAQRAPASRLPRLCAGSPALRHDRGALEDLRLLSHLLIIERWARRLPDAPFPALVDTVLSSGATGLPLLESVLLVLADTEALPVYDDADRLDVIQSVVAAPDLGLSPADIACVVRGGQWAPTALASLLRAPRAFFAYVGFLAPLETFRTASIHAGFREARVLLDAARDLKAALETAGVRPLVSLWRSDLIDTFDQVLKAVLGEVVERRDQSAYQRYLDLLAAWISFAQAQEISAVDDAALATFRAWIDQARQAPLPESFLLEVGEDVAKQLGDDFIRWQVLMPVAGSMAPTHLPLQNPHQLHNLLHQWMLFQFRADTGLALPARLRRLLGLADGFGDARSYLLRLTRSVLEISLPLVVHKASFSFTRQDLTVEFAELPDAPEEETGRLLMFEALARRLSEWEPAWEVSCNRVSMLGTWTLFLRVWRSDDAPLSADDFHKLLVRLRVMFDAAYDFSYIPNHDVAHADAMFGEMPWKGLFLAYAAYRETLNFSLQRTTVYSLPFATTWAALCLNDIVREETINAYQAGFEHTWQSALNVCGRLLLPTDGFETWGKQYMLAGQLGVLLAAVWPLETLERLASTPVDPVAGDRIAVSLLHRHDIAAALRTHLARGDEAGCVTLRHLALRHVPAAVIDEHNAADVAAEVVRRPQGFKRCKEYLLAYHADHLSESVCRRLLENLLLVPYGERPETEVVLQALLPSPERGRFSVTQVDYVALLRALSSQSAP